MIAIFRCYLKLGEWEENINGLNERSIPQILQYYTQAVEKDKNWYKVSKLLGYISVLFWKFL